MATEEKDDIVDEGAAKSQSGGELFSGETFASEDSFALASQGELSAHDVFVGGEDFYELLEDSEKEVPEYSPAPSVASAESAISADRRARFSSVQKALVISMLAVASMLAYVLVEYPIGRAGDEGSPSGGNVVTDTQQPPVQEPAVVEPEPVRPEQIREQVGEAQPLLSPAEPMSLQVARGFFQQKDYERARVAYDQLRQTLPAREELLRDFLKLRMAVCSTEVGAFSDASGLLVEISRSPSPMVRIVANYRLSLLEIMRKRYLRARTRAYNALALIKAVDFNDDWALAFECDCHFLVAECLTRHILSLSHAESDLPADLWAGRTASLDPFAGLGEADLRVALNSGSEHLSEGLLGPKIRKVTSPPRWAITSYGAPVEELLSKFAAVAALDVEWAFNETTGSQAEYGLIRQRPVSLYLPAVTSQQVALIAAGCVGLLARPENELGNERVVVHDPTAYTSLRRHISFLSEQAISLWQKFALTFYSDERLGNAHFVMGLLQSQTERPTEAIAEYKLVANRFSQTQVAPYALLHSSKVKAGLRDFRGARDDLRQLVEQYDDSEIYGQAYLRLADATREASFLAEAALLYQRVYNFGLSRQSQIASAIGAAECFYQTKSYENAAKWITRYITLAEQDENINLYSAHFLLGRTNLALGNYRGACNAFQYALVEQSSRQQYIEALMALVNGHIEQENFVEALDALENVRSVALSQEQSVEMLLLRSKIYRLLGLADTAIVSLRDRAQYVSDSQLSAKIAFELARCDVAKGNLEDARRRLSEVLGIVEPGPLAQRVALELTAVCLKLGRGSQAVSICRQLLNSNIAAEMRQETLRLLAAAYKLEKDYDKAALAFSGQWN
ncbi:MAG: tetratricopeptide repeat protein [Planctomycetota bacterium]|jgi:TolA-binding protein